MLESFCRTCMCQVLGNTEGNIDSFNIFTTNDFAQKLIQCTNLQIEPYDEYPSLVCEKCFENVLSFYEFQKMCRDSLDKFAKMLENKSDVEGEDVLAKSVEGDIMTKSKGFVVNQMELKCEKYAILELDGEDPLLAATNALMVQELEVENSTSSSQCKELKCDKYAILELDGEDPLLAATNALMVQDVAVEKPTSSSQCNERRSKRVKRLIKSTEKKEEDIKEKEQVTKKKNERKETKGRLSIQNSEENTNSDVELEPEDENDDSEDILANSSDDEVSVSDSDSALPDFTPKTSRGLQFRCDMCSKKFRFLHRLEAHMRRHEGQRGYPCTRENCERTFNRLSYLQQHLNDHDGIPRTIYKCDRENCQQSYTCKSGLRAHNRKYHSSKPLKSALHMCESCGAVLTSSRSLRDHRYIHIDKAEWPFVCDVEGCSKRFRILNQLKIHKKRHAGIKNYACPHCDMRFVTRTNMKNHINNHTLERTWSCEFCPKVCNTPAGLRAHIQNKHGQKASVNSACQIKQTRRFQCSFCDSGFLTVDGKKYHEMIHTGEKPHVCEECGKKFRQPAGLKTHMRTHIKDAPRGYECRTCGRAFFTAQTLRHHEMKHTGEKPYKCEECGFSFRWPNNLTRHQKLHLRDDLNEKNEMANNDANVESKDSLKSD